MPSWFRKIPKSVMLVSPVTTLICTIYLIKDLNRGTKFEKDVRCDGKVAIVTGGSSGIGKEIARDLAGRGAIVYLLCRDSHRCTKARKEIVLSTKNKYVYARQCDLGCLQSIKEFAEKFHQEESKLDILINNAGVWCLPYERTKDGIETQFAVNYLGHFYLTNLLLDVLIKSAPSRIINVTAATYKRGKINKDDLNSEKSYSKIEAYNQSKLANVLFTMELSKRLQGTGVTANVVDPGIALTSLYRVNSWFSAFYTFPLKPILWIFCKSPEGGAQTALCAALDPDLEKVTGKLFADCKMVDDPPHSEDETTAKWLWAVSEKWTRLKDSSIHAQEPILYS